MSGLGGSDMYMELDLAFHYDSRAQKKLSAAASERGLSFDELFTEMVDVASLALNQEYGFSFHVVRGGDSLVR